jgi:hypothetical protein
MSSLLAVLGNERRDDDATRPPVGLGGLGLAAAPRASATAKKPAAKATRDSKDFDRERAAIRQV